MNRKKQQSDLIYQLGLLLSPLQDIADHPERYDANLRARASAKFFADVPKLEMELRSFCSGEPGHVYEREWIKLHGGLYTLCSRLYEDLDNPETLMALLEEKSAAIKDGILAIPVSTDAPILEAHTPFSTYCVIKDLCQTVAKRLIWVDRYLDASVFYRYLRDVPINVHVSLLTWPSKKRSATEFSEFIDASKLYAAEKNPNIYSLVVHEDIHDRWLRCDEQIYALGGSVKDAGQKSDFTLSKVDPSEKNFNKIDQLLSAGTELYGPKELTHR